MSLLLIAHFLQFFSLPFCTPRLSWNLDSMANHPYTPKPITDIFTADTDIDRRKCLRVVPMRVLALGLGRTGTTCRLG
jgi:hypothetical protein